MRVPFLDLSRQHREIQNEIESGIRNVVSRGNFVLGPEVEHFETEWAEYCGTHGCVGVNSGTDAITIALLASGAVRSGAKDEVITSAISAGYTALAIVAAGAVPVFADVDPNSLLVDADSVESLINEKTRAIVPVHLYGQICNMAPIRAIAKKHDLTVIEDAAQTHGAWRANSDIGTTATFSFYPTKNLGACGDAGAIVSNDKEVIDKAKLLRQGGHPVAMQSRIAGRNSRLDELHAAVLRIKLAKLDDWNSRRAIFSDMYDDLLANAVHISPIRRNVRSANHLYVIQTDSRNALQKHLSESGIETQVHYPEPLHLHHVFQNEAQAGLPNAENAAQRILSLPMNSHSFEWEIEETAEAILGFQF